MKPSRPSVLAAIALGVGIAVFFVLKIVYGNLARLPLTAPISIAFVAIAELSVVMSLRPRLQGRPGTTPVPPLLAARLAALAKASAVAAAIALGLYGGLLAHVLPGRDKPAFASDAIVAGLGLTAAAFLLGVALLLEAACRLPDAPDDDANLEEPPDDPYAHR